MSITAQAALFADGFNYVGGTPTTTAKAHVTGDGAMVFTRADATVTTVTITDTASNTYTSVGVATFGAVKVFSHRCLSMTGNAANVLTPAVGSGSGSLYNIGVMVFRTTNAPFLLLNHAEANGTASTALDSGALSYSAQTSVVGAGMSSSVPGFTAGSGFTLTNVSDGLGGYFAYEYQLVSATVNATATDSGPATWGIAAMAFGETAPSGVSKIPLFFLS